MNRIERINRDQHRERSMLHHELTGLILEACFEVSNDLGSGFLENVYKNALLIVLSEKGLRAIGEYALSVSFHGQTIGQYYADILVEEKVILEIKAVETLTAVHKAQVINYLKASGIDVGLLVNFGTPKLQYYRLYKELP